MLLRTKASSPQAKRGKPLTGLWLEGDLELGPYSHLVEAFWNCVLPAPLRITAGWNRCAHLS